MGTQTDVILLDFAKAFGKVPYERLCHKLSHLGIKFLFDGSSQFSFLNSHIFLRLAVLLGLLT